MNDLMQYGKDLLLAVLDSLYTPAIMMNLVCGLIFLKIFDWCNTTLKDIDTPARAPLLPKVLQSWMRLKLLRWSLWVRSDRDQSRKINMRLSIGIFIVMVFLPIPFGWFREPQAWYIVTPLMLFNIVYQTIASTAYWLRDEFDSKASNEVFQNIAAAQQKSPRL